MSSMQEYITMKCELCPHFLHSRPEFKPSNTLAEQFPPESMKSTYSKAEMRTVSNAQDGTRLKMKVLMKDMSSTVH